MNKPKKGYGFIYKYTSPSGKSYIGQTVQSLENRAGHNGKNYLNSTYFYQAIKKYGFENFTVEILGEFPADQLNFKERYYIEAYNTLIPNGYNVQPQGRMPHGTPKPIYQYDENGLLMRRWGSEKEASNTLGINITSLHQCLLGMNKTCGDFYWSYQPLELYPIKEKISNKEKEVQMCDLEGNILQTFPSISKAAEAVQGERSAIKRCCRGELKVYLGYKWKCTEILNEKKYNNTAIAINQIDPLDNSVIQTFPSISAAARAMGASGTSLIRRVLNNGAYSAYGYKWEKAQSSTTKYS